MKLTCKTCKRSCCNGYLWNRLTGETFVVLPKDVKRINIDGIPLIRISKNRWVCAWYNRKTKKCKHYQLRPDICKHYYCNEHKKTPDKAEFRHTSLYGLIFYTKGRPLK